MDKFNIIQVGFNPDTERANNDLYCTNPKTLELLLQYETFDNNIWECCNGLSHLSNYLISNGYSVRKSDIDNYNQTDVEIIDFLQTTDVWKGDIITNPPYKDAESFVRKALSICDGKVVMNLKINFLATQKRKQLFTDLPPKTIYILSKRYSCAKDGEFEKFNNGAIDYCWIVWEKGYEGETKIKWI